ncbi:MAG: NrfD/PsrC family molybdoenzyme membrane anchor subunit [Desulfobacterales bacterium]|nr:NrfD/PsrC family molybdoenzyme membrane anchor subunit [Desulfobacterales bacterium]
MQKVRHFINQLTWRLTNGPPVYYAWVVFLLVLIGIGVYAYVNQLKQGMTITGMTDQVSWGLYIGNFTFLVGVAAAAVLLIIPAYIYHFGPIKEITILGEVLASAALIMAMLFVTVDLGRPERVWHLLPVVGTPNFPSTLLGWDVVVLNGYLFINIAISSYLLSTLYLEKKENKWLYMPFVLLSIPWAIGIHTVTAYLYNGLGARPFWNTAILVPRFLASAFCSGPAISIMAFQLIRKFTRFKVKDEALFKIAEMVAIAMGLNILLLGAEVFKELYTDTWHKAPIVYLFAGLHGHTVLVKWIWIAMGCNFTAFILFLTPATKKNYVTLNLACILIVIGVWLEKGMGFIIPGFVPTPLGEIWEYWPTTTEILVSLGILGIGLLYYTLALKIAIPIETGEMRVLGAAGVSREGHGSHRPLIKDIDVRPIENISTRDIPGPRRRT